MSQFDLTHRLTPYLDRHMVLPLLEFLHEKKLYDSSDLANAKLEMAFNTKMVDFHASEYKSIHGTEPEDLEARRASVYSELHAAREACGPLLNVLDDENDLANELVKSGQFTVEHLLANYNINDSNIDALYRFARLNFDCGRYRDAADYLFYFRLLTRDDERAFWALWGKLAAEILMVNCEAALNDLNALKEAIDSRTTVSSETQIQQRAWLIHWSLFIFFNLPNGRNLMIDFLLQDKLLNAIQASCPHILRYLTTAIIINKRRKNVLKDIVRVLQSEKKNYSDPIIEFLLALYVDFNFESAAIQLEQCKTLLANDFFLSYIAEELLENARMLVFETYCRIHKAIDIPTLARTLCLNENEANSNQATAQSNSGSSSTSSDSNATGSGNGNGSVPPLTGTAYFESRIVELIRTARVDAKIDSAHNRIVMTTEYPTVYQQVIDKTKSLSYRSQQLAIAIEKKIAARVEAQD